MGGALERSIFGTEDDAAIGALLERACADALGVEVERRTWVAASVTHVAGLVLRDGRTIVARAYQPNMTVAFVEGVIRVQRAARAAGLPAAEPLTAPITTEWGLVRFETELLADAEMRSFGDDELDASAAGLAAVVAALRSVDPTGLDEHPMAVTDDLWPPPHSPIFDFEATAAGAEWIDEIALVARTARDEDERRAIVHGDWTGRNIRLRDGRVTAIYDWESCEWDRETSGLGIAAATWRAGVDPREPPGPEEMQRYVDAYAHHRGRELTAVERRAALGAAIYAMAYSVRCQHALDPTGRESGGMRDRLRRDRDAFLELLDR